MNGHNFCKLAHMEVILSFHTKRADSIQSAPKVFKSDQSSPFEIQSAS